MTGKRTLRRAGRGLAVATRHPDDGWLLVRICFWRLLLHPLKLALPMPRLARLMWLDGGGRPRRRQREMRALALVARVYRSPAPDSGGNCFERSFVVYRLLSGMGAEPRIAIGLQKQAGEVRGHAWVEVDGQPIHDSPAFLERFDTVAVVGARGAVERMTVPAAPLQMPVAE